MPGFKPAAKGKAGGKSTTKGHASTGKGSGGCGTGAGGFKPGNTCGHKGNRNAKVESARAAHTAAKAEVLTHVKAHRKASKVAAKSGEKAAHPKELHAALKKAAAAHGALKAARDTHKAEQRDKRNAARRESRAVKSGKVSPIDARPKPPARTGQAKPPSTDKGTTADRLGVAAARHRRIAGALSKRADGLRDQAARMAGGGHPHGVAPPIGGSRGRGLGGAPVAIGGGSLTRGASDLDYAAGKLAGRARHHGARALELEGAARKAGKASPAKGPSPKESPKKKGDSPPSRKSSTFREAKTIEEAHSYAKANIADDVKGFTLDALNSVNGARHDMEAMGFKLPRLNAIHGSNDLKAHGLAMGSKNVFFHNDASAAIRRENGEWEARGPKFKLGATRDLRDVAVHEFAHNKFYALPQKMQDDVRKSIHYGIETEGPMKLSKDIGMYATSGASPASKADEVIAETAVKIVRGEKLSKENAHIESMVREILTVDHARLK